MFSKQSSSQELDAKQDFPLGSIPTEYRKSIFSLSFIMLGFVFFTHTMFAGGSIGVSFMLADALWIIFGGSVLLALYAGGLAYVAVKSGLSTNVACRYCFGDFGSKWVDFLLGFAQMGWYAWGTASIAIVFSTLLELPQSSVLPLMVLFGFAFCTTAFIGYRGLEILSHFAVPAILILIAMSIGIGINDAGGIHKLFAIEPTRAMSVSSALTIVFGTYCAGATQSATWIRFAQSPFKGVAICFIAFLVGNGLMLMTGALGGLIYESPNVVDILKMQGFVFLAIILLLINMWTTQDNSMYIFSVSACNFFRSTQRRMFIVIGAIVAILIAVGGIYNFLVPFIIFLSTFIPPIGGVLMADFFIKHRGAYPEMDKVKLKKFNYVGITSYILASLVAFFSPGIAPVNGVISAFFLYAIINFGLSSIHPSWTDYKIEQEHQNEVLTK